LYDNKKKRRLVKNSDLEAEKERDREYDEKNENMYK